MSKNSWYKTRPLGEPDAIDCGAMLSEIGSRFGLACKVEVKIEFDFKTVVVRAGVFRDMETFEAQYQALYKVPVRSSKPVESMIYQALWDVFQQADTGIAGRKPGPIYDERALRSRRRK
jgi:hypothetical protein